MKLAYIAGPYTADSTWKTNLFIRNAQDVMVKYLKLGYSVVCPHTNGAFMGGAIGEKDYEKWMDVDFEIIRRCDTAVFVKGWELSKGTVRENEFAKELGKEIIYE